MTALEEEEEEASRSRDYMAKKGAHTHYSSMISCPWLFDRIVHNPLRVAHIFWWDEPYVVARPQTPKTRCSILIASS
jgi:hypothetical protein